MSKICFLVILAIAQFGQAEVTQQTQPDTIGFSSRQGFSLRYPSNWLLASKDQTSELKEKLQPFLAKVAQYDLDHLAVVIFNPADSDTTSNLNVVVHYNKGERFPLSDDGKSQIHDLVSQVAQTFGAEITNERISIENFGFNRVMVDRFESQMQGKPLSNVFVVIPGEWNDYLATCTSAASNATRDEPVFSAILSSMVVDQDASTVPQWGVATAIGIGVIIIIGLALLSKVLVAKAKIRGSSYSSSTKRPLATFVGLFAILIMCAGLLPFFFGLALLFHGVPPVPIYGPFDLFNLTYSGIFNICLALALWEIVFLLKLTADRLRA
jgi:hypothetical protein